MFSCQPASLPQENRREKKSSTSWCFQHRWTGQRSLCVPPTALHGRHWSKEHEGKKTATFKTMLLKPISLSRFFAFNQNKQSLRFNSKRIKSAQLELWFKQFDKVQDTNKIKKMNPSELFSCFQAMAENDCRLGFLGSVSHLRNPMFGHVYL